MEEEFKITKRKDGESTSAWIARSQRLVQERRDRANLCVKALDGISNEALEDGVVEALLKMYDFAKHGDDLLLFGLTHDELDALDKLEGNDEVEGVCRDDETIGGNGG